MKISLIVQRLDSKCLKCTVTTYHFKIKFLTVLVSGKRYSSLAKLWCDSCLSTRLSNPSSWLTMWWSILRHSFSVWSGCSFPFLNLEWHTSVLFPKGERHVFQVFQYSLSHSKCRELVFWSRSSRYVGGFWAILQWWASIEENLFPGPFTFCPTKFRSCKLEYSL